MNRAFEIEEVTTAPRWLLTQRDVPRRGIPAQLAGLSARDTLGALGLYFPPNGIYPRTFQSTIAYPVDTPYVPPAPVYVPPPAYTAPAIASPVRTESSSGTFVTPTVFERSYADSIGKPGVKRKKIATTGSWAQEEAEVLDLSVPVAADASDAAAPAVAGGGINIGYLVSAAALALILVLRRQ